MILCGRLYTYLANKEGFKVETSLPAYGLSMSEDCAAAAEDVPLAVSNVTSQSGTPIIKTIKVPFKVKAAKETDVCGSVSSSEGL